MLNFEECKLLCILHTGNYLSIVVIHVFILEIFIEIFSTANLFSKEK